MHVKSGKGKRSYKGKEWDVFRKGKYELFFLESDEDGRDWRDLLVCSIQCLYGVTRECKGSRRYSSFAE